MPITPTEKIWMNGELVPWAEAQVHVLTHSLHYGTGVFEGIRAYETPNGPGIFRLTEHMERLFNSAKIMGMEIPYSLDDLVDALAELPPTIRESVRLTLAGSIANSDAAYLGRLVEAIDRLGLTSIVDIVSDPNDEELVELFRRSDIFVSASHHEGFCVPAVEALAAGCRAIVTDAGALPDTVGPGGVIVPVHDVHALSAAIAAEAESVVRVRAGDPAAIAERVARDDLVAAHLVRFTPATTRDRILAATAAALDGPAAHRAEAQ